MAMMQPSDASGIFRRNRHYHMMPVPPFIMQAGHETGANSAQRTDIVLYFFQREPQNRERDA
jgi:hypothetical protein